MWHCIHVNQTEAKWRSFSNRRRTCALTGNGRVSYMHAHSRGLLTAHAAHSLTAFTHINRTLVSSILSTAWQTWGIRRTRVRISKCVPIDKYHVFVLWTDLLCSNSMILSEMIVKWIGDSFLSSNMYGCIYVWSGHLTTVGYLKKACPQQLLQTVNERDKYNSHQQNS